MSDTKKLIENSHQLNGDQLNGDQLNGVQLNGGHIDEQSKSESCSKESYEETFNHLNNYDKTSINDNKIVKNNREPVYLNETTKQKNVLIMGLRKSGKSSIQKVVFHKMSPNETFFLERDSNKIIKDDIQTSSFVFFTIYTLPGDIENLIASSNEVNDLLNSCDALVFVLDAQDDYSEALSMLNFAIIKANKLNPNIKFEVFIHKVDCVSDDNKLEIQRDIYTRVKRGDLNDCDLESVKISFHLTSIYDHSIFEAFSKVIHRLLINELPILENLLDIFITNSGIDKAFLFDIVSKIYLATDSSAVDMQSYELCCDVIDTVVDTLSIYGVKDENELASFDGCSSTIKLNNQTVLYLREVNNYLALVCILREENFNPGLIDYNFQCFKDAIQEIFSTKNDEEIVQINGDHEEHFSIEGSSNSFDKDEKILTDKSTLNS